MFLPNSEGTDPDQADGSSSRKSAHRRFTAPISSANMPDETDRAESCSASRSCIARTRALKALSGGDTLTSADVKKTKPATSVTSSAPAAAPAASTSRGCEIQSQKIALSCTGDAGQEGCGEASGCVLPLTEASGNGGGVDWVSGNGGGVDWVSGNGGTCGAALSREAPVRCFGIGTVRRVPHVTHLILFPPSSSPTEKTFEHFAFGQLKVIMLTSPSPFFPMMESYRQCWPSQAQLS
jgi:hypothetical protein